MKVEIFRTNVKGKRAAKMILKALHVTFPEYHFNFDLEDCDRILRVESSGAFFETAKIIQMVKGYNMSISLFED
jgi:hypothetical protein